MHTTLVERGTFGTACQAGLALAVLCRAAAAASAPELILVEGGRSEFRIVVAVQAPPATRYAAEELQRFVREAAGAELPIVTDAEPAAPHEILLGRTTRPVASGRAVDFDALAEEGYIIRTEGTRLLIAGGTPRGTLYGVYDFLENEVGCRWFTPAVSRVPKVNRLACGALDRAYAPPLEYREVMLFDCWEADWMARNRLNTTKLLDERHGGAVVFVPDYYVHTFSRLVPPEEHFDAHPEYFAEVDGKRLREKTQLCATNDEVVRIVTDEVRRAFRANPGCKVISVSQNDGNGNFCRCARCAELDEREGSHAAQVLSLVNHVAETVAHEFPDRAIETLAYEWSLEPPKTIKPRDNVIIRLSTIRCSFSEPLDIQAKGKAFRRVLERWSAICRRIWIWDYTTYFSYYPLPWPNYRVMDDNIRYFVRNNVRGIVEQNNWQSTGSDMAALKGYLLARFLWDPAYDEERATAEFLEGVYGPAAPPIRAALNLLSEKVAKEHIRLTIYGSRTPPYLTREILQQSDTLWEQAAAAVAGQPEILRRVQIARLSLDYAYLEHYRWKPDGMFAYDGDPRRGKVKSIAPVYRARIERFLEFSRAAGITHIGEGEPDYDEYATWLRGLLAAPDIPAPDAGAAP